MKVMKTEERKRRCSDEENLEKNVCVCCVQKSVRGLVSVVREGNIRRNSLVGWNEEFGFHLVNLNGKQSMVGMNMMLRTFRTELGQRSKKAC